MTEGLKHALGAERAIEPKSNTRAAWEALLKDARGCTRCDLYKHATQTVFGEGPLDAAIMFVGEQPGDQEDLAGRPFVGPAGQLFDAALEEAGIDRSTVYVTNAVKHFKFVLRGKRRIHNKPDAGEITACRWWIDHERALIQPAVTVALGATAARSLIGKVVTIGKVRGAPLTLADGGECWVTVHPSFLLAHPEEDAQTRGKRAVPARPQADQGAGGGAGPLEAIPDACLDRPRRSGRDIVVAHWRSGNNAAPSRFSRLTCASTPPRQLVEKRGIDPRVARQLHRIADRREGLRPGDHTKPQPEPVGHVVAVPEREAVTRHQRHFAALGRGSRRLR